MRVRFLIKSKEARQSHAGNARHTARKNLQLRFIETTYFGDQS
jgi:hypothetical protein